ncbi:hypothetical protein Tco_0021010, partial [Tanacetum coccineum]
MFRGLRMVLLIWRMGADGNVMGIHDFLCLPEWTGAEVQEEPHHDVRPTLQRHPFYCTPPTATDGVILDPTPKDLAASNPSVKSNDDDDACYEIPIVTPIRSAAVIPSSWNQGGGSTALAAEGPNTQVLSFLPWSLLCYLSWGGIIRNYEFTREECDAPHQPTLTVLTKEIFKDPSVCKTVVDQFPTPMKMVRIEALSPDQLIDK